MAVYNGAMPPFADRTASPPRYSHAPVALTLSLADLVAADGHRVSVAISIVVRLLERPADIAVFNEQLAAERHAVTPDDVRQYVASRLRPAAEDFIATRPADACIDDRPATHAFVLQQLNAIGFACGLEFLEPMTVRTSSDSLTADRLTAAASRRQAAALDRAADLQRRLTAGGAAHLSASEQADLLPSLLQSAAAAPAKFWLAAGPSLIGVDLPSHAATAIAVDGIGPLRSVRPMQIDAEQYLAVGGQRGIALMDADFKRPPRVFIAATGGSNRGFNSAAFDADARELVAAHGEIGLVRWPIEGAATANIMPMIAARFLQKLDDRIIFAAGSDLHLMAGTEPRLVAEGTSPVVGLLQFDDAFIVVRAGGEVVRHDRTTLSEISRVRRPDNLSCAAALNVAGLAVMILGTKDGAIDVVTPGGHVLLQCRPRFGCSLIAAVGGCIAALSADRASIELLGGDGKTTMTLNLVARFGHRATDLVPSPDTPGEG